MKVVHILGDHLALGVLPGALADAITGVNACISTRGGRAQIRAPVGLGGPDRLGQRPTVRVGTFQAAEVGAVALANAGDKE